MRSVCFIYLGGWKEEIKRTTLNEIEVRAFNLAAKLADIINADPDADLRPLVKLTDLGVPLKYCRLHRRDGYSLEDIRDNIIRNLLIIHNERVRKPALDEEPTQVRSIFEQYAFF